MVVTGYDKILDCIEGAVIVSAHIEDETAMHFNFADGRCLIFMGVFTVGLYRVDAEKLH